jgi:hypothetical protein
VRLHNADDDVFAATFAPDRLAQHAEGLAHSRRIAQKYLESTAFLAFCGG